MNLGFTPEMGAALAERFGPSMMDRLGQLGALMNGRGGAPAGRLGQVGSLIGGQQMMDPRMDPRMMQRIPGLLGR